MDLAVGTTRRPTGYGLAARHRLRERREMPLWQELPLLLLVALCLAVLVRTFLVQAFFIPSGSMEQTLLVGDRVLVNKVVYDTRDPMRGEVVVFRGPSNWTPEVPSQTKSDTFMARLGDTMGDLVGVGRVGETDFIKRVIGVAGDRVSCCDPQGRILVNGRGMDESYVYENSPLGAPPDPTVCRSRRFAEILVPPGKLWVMGDHRGNSRDARCQGPIPVDHVVGKAFVVVWPRERATVLPMPDVWQHGVDQNGLDPAAAPITAGRTPPPTGPAR